MMSPACVKCSPSLHQPDLVQVNVHYQSQNNPLLCDSNHILQHHPDSLKETVALLSSVHSHAVVSGQLSPDWDSLQAPYVDFYQN
jgi:hypothetical protein